MINTAIYQTKVRIVSKSAISGEREGLYEIGEPGGMLWDAPVVQAFLEDDDLQEMTIVSSNIGFIKTITKQHRHRQRCRQ